MKVCKWCRASYKRKKRDSSRAFCSRACCQQFNVSERSRRSGIAYARKRDQTNRAIAKANKVPIEVVLVRQKGLSTRRNEYVKPKPINKSSYSSSAEFYASWEWRRLSYETKRKYGYKCMCCGAKAPDVLIVTDHIKSRKKYPELELDPNNMQVLCDACNMGKSDRYEDDFRPRIGE